MTGWPDMLDPNLLLPPLLAGLLVLATHVPLGRQVLARGILFIDLAVAQVAGLGVVAVELAGFEAHGVAGQIGAVVAALAGAALLTWSERRWPALQEALIGALFVLAASGGILLLAGDPHGGEHLREMLVGQILWVGPAQLAWTAALTALVLLAWPWAMRCGRFGFYGVFALAVTASVQLVGVYLVFASLILPALAGRAASSARALPVAYAAGVTGYIAGLLASAAFDLPAGAMIVWCLAGGGVLLAGASRMRWG